MGRIPFVYALLSAAAMFAAALPAPAQAPVTPEALRVEVVAKHPHQADTFSEGLYFHQGMLLESVGGLRRKPSLIRQVDIASGVAMQEIEIEQALTTKDICIANGRMTILSHDSGAAVDFDAVSFKRQGVRLYSGTGRGLTFDGHHYIMSNGSSVLQWRHPETFEVVSTRTVTMLDMPHEYLGDLEYVDGVLYAVVHTQDRIVRIDPETGVVTGVVSAGGLIPQAGRTIDMLLSGMAHDPASGAFYLTGRNWPHVFEVRFVPAM